MVIQLSGDWDISNAEDLSDRLKPAQGQTDVTLDLTGLRLISSTLLTGLYRIHVAREAERLPRVRLIVDYPLVRRLLEAVEFDKIFDLV